MSTSSLVQSIAINFRIHYLTSERSFWNHCCICIQDLIHQHSSKSVIKSLTLYLFLQEDLVALKRFYLFWCNNYKSADAISMSSYILFSTGLYCQL